MATGGPEIEQLIQLLARLPGLVLNAILGRRDFIFVMLIRAIVSGLGARRSSSGLSRIGDDGAGEVNGKDVRLSGSGRLKGAGADDDSAASVCMAGST